jgi:hypothetical protein
MPSSDEVGRFFQETPARIAGNRNLRVPQVEGYAAAGEYFGNGGHRAVEQIPVQRASVSREPCGRRGS